MRKIIIAATVAAIALAPLLVTTPVAHADECDSLPPGWLKQKMCATEQGPEGSGKPCQGNGPMDAQGVTHPYPDGCDPSLPWTNGNGAQ
jgi:hypothetical protein